MADEIHALNKNEIQDIDYDTYFGEMDLSDEEKEDRKKLAEKFEKIFVMLFALLSGKEETEITAITKEFIIRYESIATQYCKAKRTPSYITDYARYIVNEVVDTQAKTIVKKVGLYAKIPFLCGLPLYLIVTHVGHLHTYLGVVITYR